MFTYGLKHCAHVVISAESVFAYLLYSEVQVQINRLLCLLKYHDFTAGFTMGFLSSEFIGGWGGGEVEIRGLIHPQFLGSENYS